VNISPEMAGKVKEVPVQEGQPVELGDPLLILDDSLLASERAVAIAQLDSTKAGVQIAQNALATAQAQYQITWEAALVQGEKTRLQDWFSDPDQFEQPGWYTLVESRFKPCKRRLTLLKGPYRTHRQILRVFRRCWNRQTF